MWTTKWVNTENPSKTRADTGAGYVPQQRGGYIGGDDDPEARGDEGYVEDPRGSHEPEDQDGYVQTQYGTGRRLKHPDEGYFHPQAEPNKDIEEPVKKRHRKSGARRFLGLLGLIFMPWLVFTIVICLFTFPYYHQPKFVSAVVVFIALNAAAFTQVTDSSKYSGSGYLNTWHLLCGAYCVIGAMFGTMLGLHNYNQYMLAYWTYTEDRTYSNVIPTEPAAAHADAGKIYFADEAHVDTYKATGYMAGATYCVAPIFGGAPTSTVEYWAVGVTDPPCCTRRASFTCDDAGKAKAHAGVVVLDSASFSGISNTKYDYYMKAVKQAESAYDLVSAENPIFVRWVVDPKVVEDDYWSSGVGFVVFCSGIAFAACTVFGSIANWYAKREKKATLVRGPATTWHVESPEKRPVSSTMF